MARAGMVRKKWGVSEKAKKKRHQSQQTETGAETPSSTEIPILSAATDLHLPREICTARSTTITDVAAEYITVIFSPYRRRLSFTISALFFLTLPRQRYLKSLLGIPQSDRRKNTRETIEFFLFSSRKSDLRYQMIHKLEYCLKTFRTVFLKKIEDYDNSWPAYLNNRRMCNMLQSRCFEGLLASRLREFGRLYNTTYNSILRI